MVNYLSLMKSGCFLDHPEINNVTYLSKEGIHVCLCSYVQRNNFFIFVLVFYTFALKHLRAEPPLISYHSRCFTGRRSCDSENMGFSNCHMASRWLHEQRTMWL